MMDTPTLVKRIYHISHNGFVAFKANITKELVIMGFTVCQASPFIIAMTIKWFFTLGAYKMLNMPCFSEGVYYPLFNWPPTTSTNWYSHFIMAPQTVQLIFFLTA